MVVLCATAAYNFIAEKLQSVSHDIACISRDQFNSLVQYLLSICQEESSHIMVIVCYHVTSIYRLFPLF